MSDPLINRIVMTLTSTITVIVKYYDCWNRMNIKTEQFSLFRGLKAIYCRIINFYYLQILIFDFSIMRIIKPLFVFPNSRKYFLLVSFLWLSQERVRATHGVFYVSHIFLTLLFPGGQLWVLQCNKLVPEGPNLRCQKQRSKKKHQKLKTPIGLILWGGISKNPRPKNQKTHP